MAGKFELAGVPSLIKIISVPLKRPLSWELVTGKDRPKYYTCNIISVEKTDSRTGHGMDSEGNMMRRIFHLAAFTLK